MKTATTPKKKPAKAKLAPARRAKATVRKAKVIAKATVRKVVRIAEDAVVVAAEKVKRGKRKAAEVWQKVEHFAAAIERGLTIAEKAWQALRLAWENRHIIFAAVAGAKLAF